MDFGLYARYRPSYPASVLNMLRESGILDGSRTVADIGSGTGLFTDLLLRAGHEVFGVEPDDDARAIAERRLARHSAFTSVDGSAERTNLPAGAADPVTAASSMHWFRQDTAVAEMRRILRGTRWCVALWNFREPAGSEFGEAFDRRWRDLLGPPPAGDRSKIENEVAEGFFGAASHRGSFVAPNPFPCNESQLVGPAASSSKAPPLDTPAWMRVEDSLRSLHSEFEEDGLVWVPYVTYVCFGRLALR
ncbi:class I SAM-dependent methyltransferase [Nocardia rhamnosiphila]|uniref:class I SAM-dependent methyltransferase n=1 Tax=Nocardia rhamnosiphila TaxID=426716 RepID=UPI0033F4E729